ncbi:MAG: hypothetical protein E7206_04735 [Clostridium beijerinckii]|nr:hypothetical protein [Clostridium beijerinckii]
MKYKLIYKNGLLYTSIKMIREGKCVNIDDVIIDTGASSYAVRKRIDSISCNFSSLKDFKIDFGEIDPNERVNGLLGLDFLREAKIILDLDELVMYTQ